MNCNVQFAYKITKAFDLEKLAESHELSAGQAAKKFVDYCMTLPRSVVDKILEE